MPAVRALPIVRTSERKDFKRCQWRWWQRWRRGLVNNDVGNALWFGTGIHLALEVYYGPGFRRRPEAALATWDAYCAEDYGRLVRDDLDTKVPADQLGHAMLVEYFRQYGGDPDWYFLAVERSGEVPIVIDGVQVGWYGFTYDGVFRDMRTRKIWLLEHKTATSIRTTHLSLDDQAGSYLWVAPDDLLAAGLIKPGEQLEGIMYNFLRKGMPDERPCDPDGYRLNKNGSRSLQQPAPLFQREEVSRTQAERQHQARRVQDEFRHMQAIRTGQLPLLKTPTRDCSWDCPFFNLCELHEANQDWRGYARDAYTVEDPYGNHRKAADGG
jgi:hypothetical protein